MGGMPPLAPHIMPGMGGFAGMPGTPFIPMPMQPTAAANGQHTSAQEYVVAQQMAMQNMMQQMYMQYLNHYANIGSA